MQQTWTALVACAVACIGTHAVAVSFRGGGQQSARELAQPSWKAMVVNLDRRPDQLHRFAGAIQDQEHWLMNDGHLCRIQGRDGHALPQHRESNNDIFAFVDWSSRANVPTGTDKVPTTLTNDNDLVSGGWVEAAALHTAETGNAHWSALTADGLGLYLGHVAAWQYVIEKNLDYGIVLDDDLTLFSGNFAEQLQSILEQPLQGGDVESMDMQTIWQKKHPTQVADTVLMDVNAARDHDTSPTSKHDWDLLYLQHCDDDTRKQNRSSEQLSETEGDLLQKHADWSRIVSIPAGQIVPCTGAYVITQHGAKTLLQKALPAKKELDQQLAFVNGFRRSALSPAVAQRQDVHENDSSKLQNNDQLPDERPLKDMPRSGYLQKFLNGGKIPGISAKAQKLRESMGLLGFLQHKPQGASSVLQGASSASVFETPPISDCK